MKKDYRELYEKITNSDWFKKAYHNKSLGECPIVVEELEESEDERIRKRVIGYLKQDAEEYPEREERINKMIAYLEKQKENPKNANSIPADCVSNAKCPYKIHGEGEFVGDIRDTPAYWRGWDDAMKQKEQKPNVELIQRSWYMEGYHDREFGKEPKWIIKTGEGGPQHELNPRYGQPLADKQKPVDDKAFEEWIDDWWRHHKVNNPDSYDKGDEIQFDEREFKNWSRGIRNMYQRKSVEFHIDNPNIQKFDPNVNVTTSNSSVDGKELLYVCNKSYNIGYRDGKAEVQKPDTRDADDLQLLGFIYDLLNEIKWKDSWAMSKEECLRRLNDYHPQKPAEWSEEDEHRRTDAIYFLETTKIHYADTSEIEKTIGWLKSLPERINLQPKQEWSEEDEIERDSIIEYINSGNIYATSKVNMISWLKFLHPQPKAEWSEEDEHRREGVVEWLRDHQKTIDRNSNNQAYESIESLISWLKSLRPQPKAEWSKNDTVFLNEITDFFENKTVRLQHDLDMYAHWLKSLPERFNLQPKQEWKDTQLFGRIFRCSRPRQTHY